MHSSHGSRPDGSRCIAPPRASIPESADSVAHPSLWHKRKIPKKTSGSATAPPPSHTVQSPMSKVLHPLSSVFCPLSFVLSFRPILCLLSSVLSLSSRPVPSFVFRPLSFLCPLVPSHPLSSVLKAFRTEDERRRTQIVGPARRAGPLPPATSH